MADERIHVLRDILLELHNGASPESVQERFDATFTGVSAIEISLMEHELMTQTQVSPLKMSWNSVMSMPIFLKMLLKVSK